MENNPLLTDLIPKRLGAYWFFFLMGLTMIVAIEFCYNKSSYISSLINQESIAAFDLKQRNSIASWFIAMLWSVAAFYALLVYLICRQDHKYYQLSDIWVWGAIACLFLSLDQIAGLRIVFRDAMIYCTDTKLYGNGNLWWVSVYLIVFGMIGTRILTEIRHYLPACNSLLMAGICFIVAACAELNLIMPGNVTHQAMLGSGAVMLGGIFLVLSIGLYGRQVIITDPNMYNMWYSSIWRKLSRQVNPTLYKYKTSENYDRPNDYHNEYHQDGPHRPRRPHTATESRTRGEYWEDEENLTPADQETIRRRKGRVKKEKKGTFY